MPKITKSDLRYEYSWKATAGDNPHLIHNDARHLSRKEGYEMLDFLNHLGWGDNNKTVVYNDGKDMSQEFRLYVEWMLKEKFESTAPGRPKVVHWINDNWQSLKTSFKALKPQKA
ncbi:hypothetical protein DZC75_16500 [Pseudomonas parafulva]|uniref:Uncharacterized protein n=1 Tax=Pseudomonas parafulva TaxID=157782 RepID=A0AAI8KAZ4_9PSED|nr:hypothetical protein [Pseudomonas parafulva]AXO89524.1 hypothetical protein DZC75_16500 [Pseudomonas parafulva]